MAVGADTYADDLLRVCGGENVFGASRARAPLPDRGGAEIEAAQPEVILLPDEPYAFGPRDIEELAALATPASAIGSHPRARWHAGLLVRPSHRAGDRADPAAARWAPRAEGVGVQPQSGLLGVTPRQAAARAAIPIKRCRPVADTLRDGGGSAWAGLGGSPGSWIARSAIARVGSPRSPRSRCYARPRGAGGRGGSGPRGRSPEVHARRVRARQRGGISDRARGHRRRTRAARDARSVVEHARARAPPAMCGA